LALLHLSLPNITLVYPDERLLGWTTRPACREHWQTADLSSRWYTPQGPKAVVVHAMTMISILRTHTHLSTLSPTFLEHRRHLEALSWSSIRLLPRSLTTWRDVCCTPSSTRYHHAVPYFAIRPRSLSGYELVIISDTNRHGMETAFDSGGCRVLGSVIAHSCVPSSADILAWSKPRSVMPSRLMGF
jgi:hypothetical protein